MARTSRCDRWWDEVPTIRIQISRESGILEAMTRLGVWGVGLMLMGASVQAAEEVETVKVNGMEVRIPLPAGYVRIDGVNEEFDRVKRSFLPATNRLLLDIGLEEARSALLRGVESEMGRSMNVQVLRVLEEKNLSVKDFADYRKELRKQFASMEGSAKILDPELRKISERGSKELSKASGSEVEVSVTTIDTLGVLSEDDDHLAFGMELEIGVAAEGAAATERGYVAGTFLRVHGKVINLYCNSDSNAPAERKWALETIQSWQAAILSSNDELEKAMANVPETGVSPKKGVFSGLLRGAIIGGAIGVVVGLCAYLSKRKA